MDEDFYAFIQTPGKELFLQSRAKVVAHPDYNPYSDDIRVIEDLTDEGKFDEAVRHRNINTMLSPRANMLHAFAFSQLGLENEENAMAVVGGQILENILLTGNGSLQEPYMVTRVEDERDVLTSLQERSTAQALVQQDGRYYDRLTTESGREIYFDITDCYIRMTSGALDDLLEQLTREDNATAKKKWWKFWE